MMMMLQISMSYISINTCSRSNKSNIITCIMYSDGLYHVYKHTHTHTHYLIIIVIKSRVLKSNLKNNE